MTEIEINGEKRSFALTREQLETIAASDTPAAKYAEAILEHPNLTVNPDQRDTRVRVSGTRASRIRGVVSSLRGRHQNRPLACSREV